MTSVDGMVTQSWVTVGYLDCRLDLVFRRPGRDEAAYAVEAGRTPDRMGVLFCKTPGTCLLALDRVTCVKGPVSGSFEVTMIPDEVLDYAALHHIEVSVREVSPLIVTASPF
jgi:hypothetical protein